MRIACVPERRTRDPEERWAHGLRPDRQGGAAVRHTARALEPGQETGRFNNVDIVGNLAVVTDRGRDQLRTYAIKNGRLTDVTSAKAPLVFSKDTAEVQDQHTAYGLAATSIKGEPVVAVTRRGETRVGFFKLLPDGHGKITYRSIGYVDLPSSFKLSNGTTWSPCEEPGDRPQLEAWCSTALPTTCAPPRKTSACGGFHSTASRSCSRRSASSVRRLSTTRTPRSARRPDRSARTPASTSVPMPKDSRRVRARPPDAVRVQPG